MLEGFFPACAVSDQPARRRASGFREIGLPFESDTAITRHLAAFLTAHGDAKTGPIRPTHILFNGGVFKADMLRERLLRSNRRLVRRKDGAERASKEIAIWIWRSLAAPLATAWPSKATEFASAAGRPDRITSASKRPAWQFPARFGRCEPCASFRSEWKKEPELDVPGGEIGVVVGEQALFRFFSSAIRKQDKPGDLIAAWTEEEISETDSLEATLPPADDLEDAYVPVRFHSHITELGVFELWCVSTISNHRWKLEFSVREDADAE